MDQARSTEARPEVAREPVTTSSGILVPNPVTTAGETRTMIEVEGVDFHYGKTKALHGINLKIPEKRVTAFIGPSGCGKSTLLRCFNRMNDLIDYARVTAGTIKIEGVNINTPEVDVIELDSRTVPRAIADQLGRDRALHVLRVRRERRTSEPLMITEAWLPIDMSDTITDDALSRTPLYRLLADAGVELDRVQHEITAEIAGPRNAQLLKTAIGSALMRVNRLAFANGQPHHYLSILLSPNRSRVLLAQSAAELEAGEGMAIAHDVHLPSE